MSLLSLDQFSQCILAGYKYYLFIYFYQ